MLNMCGGGSAPGLRLAQIYRGYASHIRGAATVRGAVCSAEGLETFRGADGQAATERGIANRFVQNFAMGESTFQIWLFAKKCELSQSVVDDEYGLPRCKGSVRSTESFLHPWARLGGHSRRADRPAVLRLVASRPVAFSQAVSTVLANLALAEGGWNATMSERLESIGFQSCSREGRSNGLPKHEPHAPPPSNGGAGRQVPYRLSSHFWERSLK